MILQTYGNRKSYAYGISQIYIEGLQEQIAFEMDMARKDETGDWTDNPFNPDLENLDSVQLITIIYKEALLSLQNQDSNILSEKYKQIQRSIEQLDLEEDIRKKLKEDLAILQTIVLQYLSKKIARLDDIAPSMIQPSNMVVDYDELLQNSALIHSMENIYLAFSYYKNDAYSSLQGGLTLVP